MKRSTIVWAASLFAVALAATGAPAAAQEVAADKRPEVQCVFDKVRPADARAIATAYFAEHFSEVFDANGAELSPAFDEDVAACKKKYGWSSEQEEAAIVLTQAAVAHTIATQNLTDFFGGPNGVRDLWMRLSVRDREAFLEESWHEDKAFRGRVEGVVKAAASKPLNEYQMAAALGGLETWSIRAAALSYWAQ